MDKLLDTTIVDLVKAGVFGFAVAIMVLAYLTLQKLTAQLNAPPAALTIIARTIWIYMGLSLAVVLLGILWQMFNPVIQVSIDVSPKDISGYDVRVAGQSVKFPKERTVSLQRGSAIVLELTEFDRQITSLQMQINGLKEQAKEFKQAQQHQATTETQRMKESGM